VFTPRDVQKKLQSSVSPQEGRVREGVWASSVLKATTPVVGSKRSYSENEIKQRPSDLETVCGVLINFFFFLNLFSG
jgi:hypothetical protein